MILDQAIFALARTGELDGKLKYPLMLDTATSDQVRMGKEIFVAGRRVTAGGLGIPDEKEKWLLDDEGEIAVIPDAVNLIQRPAKFISRIMELRKNLGFKPLIYAPGIGDPYLMPALVYSGITIFDDLFIRAESSRGKLYSALGIVEGADNALRENLGFGRSIVESLSMAIKNQTLREIVEKYTISSRAVEIMRILDTGTYDFMERLYPARTPYIKANSVDSLMRPDLQRYRNRVSGLYSHPAWKDVALILPCTARKPYHTSKTHRKIFSRIDRYSRMVHKVVVTSPVGVVPEELEESYPPAFYDIPTIGKWYADERNMITEMLKSYFERNTYRKVVAYLTPDLSFIRSALPEGSEFIVGKIKSDELLDTLRATLRDLQAGYSAGTDKNARKQKLLSLASFQFGNWIGPLLEEMKLIRSYNQDMLMENGKAMLVYNERLGKLTVTKEMGKTFLDNRKFTVSIDDFKPTANVYAMGVLDATEDIRQEDEVVLEHDGELRGVGTAKMPPEYMRDLSKGVAVKVRN